jgi:hypothetical protein
VSLFVGTATGARRTSEVSRAPAMATGPALQAGVSGLILAISAYAPMFANAGRGETGASEEAREYVHVNAWPWMVVIEIVWIAALVGVLYIAVRRANRHRFRARAPRQHHRML